MKFHFSEADGMVLNGLNVEQSGGPAKPGVAFFIVLFGMVTIGPAWVGLYGATLVFGLLCMVICGWIYRTAEGDYQLEVKQLVALQERRRNVIDDKRVVNLESGTTGTIPAGSILLINSPGFVLWEVEDPHQPFCVVLGGLGQWITLHDLLDLFRWDQATSRQARATRIARAVFLCRVVWYVEQHWLYKWLRDKK